MLTITIRILKTYSHCAANYTMRGYLLRHAKNVLFFVIWVENLLFHLKMNHIVCRDCRLTNELVRRSQLGLLCNERFFANPFRSLKVTTKKA